MITIVATGVTGGCGLAAIQQLISNNRGPYRLIIGSRHALESAEAKTAAEDLLAHRKSSKTTIDYLPLDLTSLDSVRSFAKNVKERLSEGTEGIQVDVNHLLLCAGAVCNKRRAINLSQTGTNEVEETVVVNSLSQILLTQLLLDNLDPDARVTIVNSQMHLRAPQSKSLFFASFSNLPIVEYHDLRKPFTICRCNSCHDQNCFRSKAMVGCNSLQLLEASHDALCTNPKTRPTIRRRIKNSHISSSW